MFYRVQALLAFDEEDEAKDFFHDCEIALGKAITINPGTLVSEPSFTQLEECHHNEPDPLECAIIDRKQTPP